jgi:hypothetical protein
MDQVATNPVPPAAKRLVYRIGGRLPKALRILYYIVLCLTFIYLIYRFFEWFLVTVQKIGAFIFEPRNYWAAVMSLFILAIGAFILAQFILGLDPVGNTIEWIESKIKLLEGRYT